MKEDISNCWYKGVCNNTCTRGCIRYNEMKYLMESSGIPKAKQKPQKLQATSDDYDSFVYLNDIKNDIVNFVNNGENLYIYSANTGNGKTSWAIKLLLKYFDCIWAGNGFKTRGLFVHVPTLLLKLKDFENPMSEEDKQQILDADIVVWDDIGTTITNYDHSQLLNLIDRRMLAEKANIFTSNLDGNGLAKTLGARLASRIYNSSQVVQFKGGDCRGTTTNYK